MVALLAGIASENIVNWVEKKIREDAEGELAHIIGADFLDFIYDEYEMAYHSKVETWQRAFGYNDIYDQFFEYGSDMHKDKLLFTHGKQDYIIWMWKGDYWNLQGGAETGLYVYDKNINNEDHYDVVDFNLPMTLSLYRRCNNKIENVFLLGAGRKTVVDNRILSRLYRTES